MTEVIAFIADPWRFNFIIRGLQAGLLVAAVCAVLGTFVVLRGMAFLGEALAHSVLPGIVVAFMLGINLFIGALLAGLLTAAGIGWVSRRDDMSEDTSIGIIFSGFLALGIALLSRINSYRDLTHILFGNILGVSRADLLIMLGVVVVVLVTVAVFFRELIIFTFDPTHSAAIGIPMFWMRYLLLGLLVLAIVAAIQAVGVVLVISLLVTPAATAYLISDHLSIMMIRSVLISAVASIVGLYASFYADISSGPVIVLTLTAIFLVVFIWQQFQRSHIRVTST